MINVKLCLYNHFQNHSCKLDYDIHHKYKLFFIVFNNKRCIFLELCEVCDSLKDIYVTYLY